MTHTFVFLDVSRKTFDEITKILTDADYEHCFTNDGEGRYAIDMNGLALRVRESE